MLFNILILYLICINIIAVFLTVYDKLAAIYHKWRISEKALLVISTIGGSIAMFLTMLIIRHKTRKTLFMIGIPAIILVQIAAVIFVLVKL